ncbi:MAG TPA: MmgE/PrpD family protein [Vicinamibacterales bacterium]|nr:MmgE/PrpD family protein [Vicinamibacterales bacterium]
MLNLGAFVVAATPPPDARTTAVRAFVDTIGVTLAGAAEPAARIVQRVVARDGAGPCRILGTAQSASVANAALANGTAAHAHDFDDMCFVSLAHPSAPLVAAALAAGEVAEAPGRALLDAYIVGFEIEGRLGRAMNPRHYQRGWHCTSTIGTIGATAAACRLRGLSPSATNHALAIAASEASGLKENFGSMVKPLHAGLAARNAIVAAELARAGMTASLSAIDGPQGFLAAFDSASVTLDDAMADLGTRWEILDTGITVKLYPSCAATHPSLDAMLDLCRAHGVRAEDVATVTVGVDPITPTVLLYDAPANALEAKFSMPFCIAAAIVDGRVGLDTFDDRRVADPEIATLRGRVRMTIDPTLDASAPPLTQARVTVQLTDGRTLTAAANGARGYHEQPATDQELTEKFVACASRVLDKDAVQQTLEAIRDLRNIADVNGLTARSAARGRVSTP